MYGPILVIHYSAFIYVSLEDIKHTKNIIFFLQSTKMSSLKKIKNLRLIKIMKELKDLEDAIKEINKIEELETEIVIESTKRKLSEIEKEKINKINELKEDLRTETLERKMKEKPVSFKMKNKEIARKKLIELEKEIKAEIITRTEEYLIFSF